MRWQKPIVLSFALLASSCATYADMQSQTPNRIETVKGDAAVVADCVHAQLVRNNPEWTYTRVNEAGQFHISGGAGGQTPNEGIYWDVSFATAGPGSVTVTLRTNMNIWGSTVAPAEIWQIVHSCAH